MRRKLVAGNWKMHMTAAEAAAVAEALFEAVEFRDGVDVVVCPPYLCIPKLKEVSKNTRLQLGAQDVFWMPKGAYTGKVSAPMLKAANCEYCIVGHSETRGRFGKLEIPETTLTHFAESDHTVNLKIGALLEQGIRPILCVGETLGEREAGMTDAVITSQLEKALHGFVAEELQDCLVVAYEPVWAIGTGQTCMTDEAERVCNVVRTVICEIAGKEAAQAIRVLYGGSVKASNARELFQQPNIDGGLVGGASLDPKEFAQIVGAAS